jgi:hypothetical protein
MEESRELQRLYGFMQIIVYTLLGIEIFVFLHFSFPEKFAALNVIFDRIRTIGMYQNIFYTKLGTLIFMLATCVGTRAKKDIRLNISKNIVIPIIVGFLLFFGSACFNISKSTYMAGILRVVDVIYIILTFTGALFINTGLDSFSKLVKSNLMKDRFNIENESFEQSKNLTNTKYSVNIPMMYYHNKRRHKGWINIVNPFRGTLLTGVPGTGKTFSVVNTYIRQLSEKGFMMFVYDFKYPDLSKLLFYQYRKAKASGVIPKNTQFNVINFNKIEYSRRVNPLKAKYITTLSEAQETATSIVDALKKGEPGEGGSEKFFSKSAVNFLTCCIYFFAKYEVPEPDGKKIKGKWSDLPHILAFMTHNYSEIFNVLFTNIELLSLLKPFESAYKQKAWEQLEGQIGTLRIEISQLATKEAFWIFSEDPQYEINLKISDKQNPSYLIVASDPDVEDINSTLNSVILNRLVRQINSKGNLPCALIVDELPTIYFHRIEKLVATARSNKVAVLLALQDLPQLKRAYGDKGANVVTSVCGNILSGAVRNKETLDWLEKIFGKIKQISENVSVDRNRTTVSQNEKMDLLIPGSKISNLQTGELVGQIALDYDASVDDDNFKITSYHCKTDLDTKKITEEEKKFVDCPKFYNFVSDTDREEILLSYYQKILSDIDKMITTF